MEKNSISGQNLNNSLIFENNSVILGTKEPKNKDGLLRSTPFIDKIMSDFMQEGLFKGS